MITSLRIKTKNQHIDWLNEQDAKLDKMAIEQGTLPLSGYPDTPGYKNKDRDGPSRRAAIEITPHAVTVRDQCLEALRLRVLTADEVAHTLKHSILTVRPRIAELAKLGRIEDSGQRRTNHSGKQATVWRAVR